MDRECIVEAIINALDGYYGDTGRDDDDLFTKAACLKWLYAETKARDFRYEFDRLCEQESICPKCCNGHVQQVTIGSEQLDCFGTMCWHDEYTIRCDNCGEEF